MNNFVVAIDGPAGSGKSSISKIIAKKMNFTHLQGQCIGLLLWRL